MDESIKKSVTVLKTLRTGKRQSVTKTALKIETSLNEMSCLDCKNAIEKLCELKGQLIDYDKQINQLMLQHGGWTETEFLKEASVDETYTDQIRCHITSIESKMASLGISVQPSGSGTVSNHKVTLPKIELPMFDGKPESYNKFILSFENLISKYNLSSYEKFSYLSQQLTGSAKIIIESLSLNDMSYTSAKKLLDSAYSNKLDQQYSVITSLCQLSLNPELSDAFGWIGEARLLDEQIRSLEITSEIFTQFFIWRSLPDEFKNHLTAITNKTRPSLQEIRDSMFEANMRYIEQRKSSTRTHREGSHSLSAALAINVSDVKAHCTLCTHDNASEQNHKLSQCPVYSDRNEKITKLKSIKGCVKCGFTSHCIQQCNYKFLRPCYKCSGSHMSFLCAKESIQEKKIDPKTPIKINSDEKPITKATTSGVVSTVSMTLESYNDVILPTATVYIGDDKQNPVRLFKDIGSQSSFVRGPPESIPGAEIVKQVKINVRGMNTIQSYDAPLIRFSVQIHGQGKQTLEAICVPKLNTQFSVPGLASLVSRLQQAGLSMADNFLKNDFVDDIVILLGSDHSHLLPLVQHNYQCDANDFSVLYKTPAGIMLAGSVSNYLKNMPALPPNLCEEI